ncbi:MAG: YheU family protein [Porticoccaceae bacterium]|nr:YheU family protein [Porticoccaceae bacterium]
MLEIPPERLSADVLQAILEEYINREGTDYGAEERSLESKVSQLQSQLAKGELVICFDTETQSCSLLTRRDFAKQVALQGE